MNNDQIVNSSFRDPSGFLFYKNGELYRQINNSYQDDYDLLMDSGLYQTLTEKKMLVSHQEVSVPPLIESKSYKIIKPELIPFISYPYEWCFSQLKDAALTTLEIQKCALDYGMTLKDSSVYNIQFKEGRPLLIDTLSFEKYQEGKPWKAYRQFCQHFFAPLTLMSHKDIRLSQLLQIFIDGIPLDLTSKLLPTKTKTMFTILSHIHAHAKSQKHYESKQAKVKDVKLGKRSFLGIIDSLHSGVKKLKWTPENTEWGDYYSDTNYSETAFNHKKEIVSSFLDETNPKIVWDLGANLGEFSRISNGKGIQTISFDIDPAAVEKNYLTVIENDEKNLLPLLLDLTNPSSNIGWNNAERLSIQERGNADCILALALIHHLAISNNVPLVKIAKFFRSNCKQLLVEFIPKEDSQVQRLLASREDIFDEYTKEKFEEEFSRLFEIQKKIEVKESKRILYFMNVK
jgi:ribosomal protein L11 methylase PrmA